jgi:hypothetical protein
MTIANFGLLVLLTYQVIKANSALASTDREEELYQHFEPRTETPGQEISEGLAPVVLHADVIEPAVPRTTRAQSAVSELKPGESPEQVTGDHGYSRSAAGIGAASSRKSLVEV